MEPVYGYENGYNVTTERCHVTELQIEFIEAVTDT